MAEPATILAILQFVCTAATVVSDNLNKPLEVNLKHEARRALKELRKGSSLIQWYTRPPGCYGERYKRVFYSYHFIQLYVWGGTPAHMLQG